MRFCALIGAAAALVAPHTLSSRDVRRRAADDESQDRPSRTVRLRAADDESQNFEVVGSSTVSLKSQFERALVLQRAGDVDGEQVSRSRLPPRHRREAR